MSEQSSAGQNTARAATAVANIARGAASGGIYGAAVGAAEAFFPELVKGAVILLFIVVLGPMLIFTALPNVMFGYDSVTSPDVADFTESARDLDALYQTMDNRAPSILNRLVESILPKFMFDGAPEYDDYTVDQNLGNINKYWLIAIGSVRYHQDLSVMDADAVDEILYDRLTYTASIKDRILGIFVKDLTPERYMDKLGFTEEEKNWASVLYSVLAEEQNLSYEDSDGAGYYDSDYGNITFKDTKTEVVYYNQTDSRWGNKMYGKSGTIGEAGCGPTALAMVVTSLTTETITPFDVAQWSVESGHRCEGNGSYLSLIPDGGEHYGLHVSKLGNDAEKVVDALENGKLVVALMSRGHFTRGGHFIVLRGVTADGAVLVADPASVKRSNQEWPLGIIVNEARRGAAAGGPFWAFSK